MEGVRELGNKKRLRGKHTEARMEGEIERDR